MDTPKVSVIIPTYNGAEFLGEAIESVLNQTYSNLELIVVSDASPDNTSEVIKRYNDPRLIYIEHPQNRGADVARHTALHASSGEIIAFLDQDDFFHPEKLHTHVAYLKKHPEVGFTYNARFELNYSAKTIRDLWRPPRNITLADLVVWFPIAPSDAVIRRNWALQMDLLGAIRGAEIAHFGNLFLSGCQFGYIDRALNYRRYHSGRTVKNLVEACEKELINQDKIFEDPRCPAVLLSLRPVAQANLYMYWAYLAFVQGETAIGQQLIRNAANIKPTIKDGRPGELLTNFLINSIDDENQDHSVLLQKVLSQLPEELSEILSEQFLWAVGQGYLLKGVRAFIWGRPEDGHTYCEQAIRAGAQVDDFFIGNLVYQLRNYEAEYGIGAAPKVLMVLAPHLEKMGGSPFLRKLNASYSINRAFSDYQEGKLHSVPATVFQAITSDPRYLFNRGVLSIFIRSSVGRWTKLP